MGGSLERVARRLWSAWVLSRSVRLCCHPLSFADCIESLTFCVCFGVYVSSFVSDRRSFFVSFLVGGFLFPVLFPRHSFMVFVILFGLFVDLSFSPLGLFCWFLCFGGVPWLLGSCLGSRLWLALVFGERGCVFLVWIRLIPASLSLCSCLFAPAGSLPRRRPRFLFWGVCAFLSALIGPLLLFLDMVPSSLFIALLMSLRFTLSVLAPVYPLSLSCRRDFS